MNLLSIISIFIQRYYYGDFLSQRAVEGVFRALFLLTDLRGMLRATAPHHRFDDTGKARIRTIIASVKEELAVLEKELTE